MEDYIKRQALYEKAATLEAQALDYVGKLIERDGDETSTEWRIWSAILAERTAFKHDVYDAPSADVVEVVRCRNCSACSTAGDYLVCLRFGFLTDYNRYCAWGGELKEE